MKGRIHHGKAHGGQSDQKADRLLFYALRFWAEHRGKPHLLDCREPNITSHCCRAPCDSWGSVYPAPGDLYDPEAENVSSVQSYRPFFWANSNRMLPVRWIRITAGCCISPTPSLHTCQTHIPAVTAGLKGISTIQLTHPRAYFGQTGTVRLFVYRRSCSIRWKWKLKTSVWFRSCS